MRLRGKVAVITGAASGIGRATAEVFAAEGAHLALADVNPAGEAVAGALAQQGYPVRFWPTDVTDEAAVAGLMDRTVATYGRLDVLVAAAGILQGAYVPVDALDLATFRRVVEVNLTGAFLCAKHAVRHMRAAGRGVILLLASGAGVRGGSSSVAYGASKGGVHGLALVLEQHLAPLGIRVHAVCPGNIATPMKLQNIADQARALGQDPEAAVAAARPTLGEPRGVAEVLAFLASDAADYLRGTVHTR
jgi:NAD(P)-dependent dehydrogenase (short-subunit alcohol dehydrogenase family)